jgi:hypothetical protein
VGLIFMCVLILRMVMTIVREARFITRYSSKPHVAASHHRHSLKSEEMYLKLRPMYCCVEFIP